MARFLTIGTLAFALGSAAHGTSSSQPKQSDTAPQIQTAPRKGSVPQTPIVAPSPIKMEYFNEGVNVLLSEDLQYQIASTGITITVPEGFVSDFASIPRIFRSILSPTGRHGRAAIIHDYLYWQQECTREQADHIMLLAMTESGVSWVGRRFIHWTLRRFGLNAWVDNLHERKRGLPRHVPKADAGDVPPLAEWPTFREELFKRGVRPTPQAVVTPAYCGVSMDIQIGQ